MGQEAWLNFKYKMWEKPCEMLVRSRRLTPPGIWAGGVETVFSGLESDPKSTSNGARISLSPNAAPTQVPTSKFTALSATDLEGKTLPEIFDFAQLRGKAFQGLEILGFPSNQFGKQEPGPDAQIISSTQGFGVKFPVMTKCDVNGAALSPERVILILQLPLCAPSCDEAARTLTAMLLSGEPDNGASSIMLVCRIGNMLVRLLAGEPDNGASSTCLCWRPIASSRLVKTDGEKGGALPNDGWRTQDTCFRLSSSAIRCNIGKAFDMVGVGLPGTLERAEYVSAPALEARIPKRSATSVMLRQNAAIMRHAAPEVTPHKETWTIYVMALTVTMGHGDAVFQPVGDRAQGYDFRCGSQTVHQLCLVSPPIGSLDKYELKVSMPEGPLDKYDMPATAASDTVVDLYMDMSSILKKASVDLFVGEMNYTTFTILEDMSSKAGAPDQTMFTLPVEWGTCKEGSDPPNLADMPPMFRAFNHCMGLDEGKGPRKRGRPRLNWVSEVHKMALSADGSTVRLEEIFTRSTHPTDSIVYCKTCGGPYLIRFSDYRENARREAEFRQDLFTSCSNLFEVHHVHHGAECIFGVLNEATLRSISPTMKASRRKLLTELVVDTIEEWVLLHKDSFSRIDGRKLLEVVGPAAFIKLVPRLGISFRALSSNDLEVLFYHLTEEVRDLFGVIRVALSMCPVDSLSEPLGETSWSLRRVLKLIEARRSEHALRFFLAHLDAPLLLQALSALRERDLDTGLSRDSWSFMSSLRIEADVRAGKAVLPDLPAIWPMYAPTPAPMPQLSALDEDREIPRGQKMFLTDGELMPFTMRRRKPMPLAGLARQSRLRDTAWPQLAFDPAQALAEERGEIPSSASGADAYFALSGDADEVDALTLWGGQTVATTPVFSSFHEGLPSPQAELPLDAVHFVDSAQALSHVLTFLQQSPPAFVGIDLEWADPQPVSIIQIATPSRAFILDCVNRTPLYMSVLWVLVEWLLKREATTKLFFGFPHDLVRLNMLFGPQGKTFGGKDHIASVLDLYMQRIRRVKVYEPRAEDTPLGREDLLGSALYAQDLEEVQRLGAQPLPEYPNEEPAEKVFTIGGHQSLARLVQRYLGEDLNKTFQVSNWNFRPLSAAQVIYAATDAHILLRVEAAMRLQNACSLDTPEGAEPDQEAPATSASAAAAPASSEAPATSAPAAAAPASSEEAGADVQHITTSADFWRCQVEAIYRKRNPQKLGGVEALLEKHKGKEVVLYAKVCKVYDLDSSKFYADPKSWEQYEQDVQEDEPQQSTESTSSGSTAGGVGVSVPSLFGITSATSASPFSFGGDSGGGVKVPSLFGITSMGESSANESGGGVKMPSLFGTTSMSSTLKPVFQGEPDSDDDEGEAGSGPPAAAVDTSGDCKTQ
ncbi:unnamed protein product [Polarella glacialis]|uniref:3'-5' exonuclease domain-containing protein n=1 Tax=Polarella glacialis TaxID=89957 RepID=A0A813GRZ4_POLGL|nr:unnamed protein product [Polarella glacialis]